MLDEKHGYVSRRHRIIGSVVGIFGLIVIFEESIFFEIGQNLDKRPAQHVFFGAVGKR
ncbi:MAG: hypothetical protein QM811_28570 [Pirellulales bacterium]